MKNLIFYFTRSPNNKKVGLIFPSELEEERYYGTGSFYLHSAEGESLKNEYIIFAIHNDKLIKVVIEKNSESNNFYHCFVNEVGNFIFYAEKLKTTLKYIGIHKSYTDLNISYRLRLWNIKNAEISVLKHDFYFLGFSNIINA